MYAAVLIAPDGDYVTDHRRDTIEEVWEALADQGSRWFFYPFCGVIRDHVITRKSLRLVDVAPPFDDFRGRSISALSRTIAEMPDQVLQFLLG